MLHVSVYTPSVPFFILFAREQFENFWYSMLSLSSSNHLNHSSKQKIFTEEKIRIHFFDTPFFYFAPEILNYSVCVCVCVSTDAARLPILSPVIHALAATTILFQHPTPPLLFHQPMSRKRVPLVYFPSATPPLRSQRFFVAGDQRPGFSFPRHCPRCCSPGANELWLISRNDVYRSLFSFFPSFFFRESAPPSR